MGNSLHFKDVKCSLNTRHQSRTSEGSLSEGNWIFIRGVNYFPGLGDLTKNGLPTLTLRLGGIGSVVCLQALAMSSSDFDRHMYFF